MEKFISMKSPENKNRKSSRKIQNKINKEIEKNEDEDFELAVSGREESEKHIDDLRISTPAPISNQITQFFSRRPADLATTRVAATAIKNRPSSHSAAPPQISFSAYIHEIESGCQSQSADNNKLLDSNKLVKIKKSGKKSLINKKNRSNSNNLSKIETMSSQIMDLQPVEKKICNLKTDSCLSNMVNLNQSSSCQLLPALSTASSTSPPSNLEMIDNVDLPTQTAKTTTSCKVGDYSVEDINSMKVVIEITNNDSNNIDGDFEVLGLKIFVDPNYAEKMKRIAKQNFLQNFKQVQKCPTKNRQTSIAINAVVAATSNTTLTTTSITATSYTTTTTTTTSSINTCVSASTNDVESRSNYNNSVKLVNEDGRVAASTTAATTTTTDTTTTTTGNKRKRLSADNDEEEEDDDHIPPAKKSNVKIKFNWNKKVLPSGDNNSNHNNDNGSNNNSSRNEMISQKDDAICAENCVVIDSSIDDDDHKDGYNDTDDDDDTLHIRKRRKILDSDTDEPSNDNKNDDGGGVKYNSLPKAAKLTSSLPSAQAQPSSLSSSVIPISSLSSSSSSSSSSGNKKSFSLRVKLNSQKNGSGDAAGVDKDTNDDGDEDDDDCKCNNVECSDKIVVIDDDDDLDGKVHQENENNYGNNNNNDSDRKNINNDNNSDDNNKLNSNEPVMTVETTSLVRRSSRLNMKMMNNNNNNNKNVDCSEGDGDFILENSKSTKQQQKRKPQRHQQPPENKMASIFTRSKPAKNNKSVEMDRLKQEMDERKRLFLMSGVPDVLKKYTDNMALKVTVDSLIHSFPPISHVNSLSEDELLFLSTTAAAASEFHLPSLPSPPPPSSSYLSSSQQTYLTKPVFMLKLDINKMMTDKDETLKCITNSPSPSSSSSSSSSLTEVHVNQILAEIKTSNVLFPVFEFYSKLKLKKNSDRLNNISQNANASQESLWTEKYRPTDLKEVIGNRPSCRRLHDWLNEWKLKLGHMTGNGEFYDDDWLREDDSYSNASNDNNNSSSSSSNSMIIVGKHGVGKTCMVYAAARELGFKVFEVNSSSNRDGRHVLTQLQEATQSHQLQTRKQVNTEVIDSDVDVVKFDGGDERKEMEEEDKDDGENDGEDEDENDDESEDDDFEGGKYRRKRKRKASIIVKKVEDNETTIASTSNNNNNCNTTLLNFFNLKPSTSSKIATKTSTLKTTSTKIKKAINDIKKSKANKPPTAAKIFHKISFEKNKPGRKQLKKTSNIISRPAKIQKMSSEELPSSIINAKMSLILFDEVDIVFNLDRGFLSAVQKFIKITKRPIVLTTNDGRFRERFNSDIEAINLTKPEKITLVTYLQLICLAEGFKVNRADVDWLVDFFNHDIRRCLLQLQLCLTTNQVTDLISYQPIVYKKIHLENNESTTKTAKNNGNVINNDSNNNNGDSITNNNNNNNSSKENRASDGQGQKDKNDRWKPPQPSTFTAICHFLKHKGRNANNAGNDEDHNVDDIFSDDDFQTVFKRSNSARTNVIYEEADDDDDDDDVDGDNNVDDDVLTTNDDDDDLVCGESTPVYGLSKKFLFGDEDDDNDDDCCSNLSSIHHSNFLPSLQSSRKSFLNSKMTSLTSIAPTAAPPSQTSNRRYVGNHVLNRLPFYDSYLIQYLSNVKNKPNDSPDPTTNANVPTSANHLVEISDLGENQWQVTAGNRLKLKLSKRGNSRPASPNVKMEIESKNDKSVNLPPEAGAEKTEPSNSLATLKNLYKLSDKLSEIDCIFSQHHHHHRHQQLIDTQSNKISDGTLFFSQSKPLLPGIEDVIGQNPDIVNFSDSTHVNHSIHVMNYLYNRTYVRYVNKQQSKDSDVYFSELLKNHSAVYNKLRRSWQSTESMICHLNLYWPNADVRMIMSDYLPCLKSICKMESKRKKTNTRRRFLHYLKHCMPGMNFDCLENQRFSRNSKSGNKKNNNQ